MANTWLARSLAIGLAAVLSWLAWRDAATAYWLSTAPKSAPASLASQPRLRVTIDGDVLLAPGPLPARSVSITAQNARALLRQEPLDAVAVRQVALAKMHLGENGGATALHLAERLSRREPGTQAALLDLAGRKGDYRGGLDHLDKTLTVFPQAGAGLMPALAAMLADRRFRDELRPYRSRAWVPALLTAGLDTQGDAVPIARFMIEAGMSPQDLGADVLPRTISVLLAAGQGALASEVATRVGGASSQGIREFGFTRDATRADLAPLTWQFPADDRVQARPASARAMVFEIDANSAATVALRVTALTPGRYELSHRISHQSLSTSLELEWLIACIRPGGDPEVLRTEAITVAGSSMRVEFSPEIVSSCPLQQWELRAQTGDAQLRSAFVISDLALVRR